MNLASLLPFVAPLVVGLAALAFITLPLWSGGAGERQLQRAPLVISREQLELDRELGKIDATEYDELNALLPADEPKFGAPTVEALVGAFRRNRKLDASVEAEILVARARRKAKQSA